VADGCDGESVNDLVERLIGEGAVPRLVGSKLGQVTAAGGELLEIDVPVDAAPSVLFDAAVVAGGKTTGSGDSFARDGRVMEFIKDQYRHCKPLLVLGEGRELLQRAGIPFATGDAPADPGLIVESTVTPPVADAFLAAIARHRHFERETDPPRV
jgi:catalase